MTVLIIFTKFSMHVYITCVVYPPLNKNPRLKD